MSKHDITDNLLNRFYAPGSLGFELKRRGTFVNETMNKINDFEAALKKEYDSPIVPGHVSEILEVGVNNTDFKNRGKKK